jgi:hypothetical protein
MEQVATLSGVAVPSATLAEVEADVQAASALDQAGVDQTTVDQADGSDSVEKAIGLASASALPAATAGLAESSSAGPQLDPNYEPVLPYLAR